MEVFNKKAFKALYRQVQDDAFENGLPGGRPLISGSLFNRELCALFTLFLILAQPDRGHTAT